MGNVQATNSLNEAVIVSTSILNSSIQNCKSDISSNQSININNCDDIEGNNINIGGYYTFDAACVQKASSSDDVRNAVDKQFGQTASAINQQLGFTSTQANNLITSMTNLSTVIVNTYSQTCSQNTISNNTININCPTTGGKVDLNGITIENYQDFTAKCLQDSDSVSQIINNVKEQINQSAVAKVESIFGPLTAIILIIVIFLIGFFFIGADILTSPYFWGAVIIIYLIYLAMAWILDWFPFPSKKPSS